MTKTRETGIGRRVRNEVLLNIEPAAVVLTCIYTYVYVFTRANMLFTRKGSFLTRAFRFFTVYFFFCVCAHEYASERRTREPGSNLVMRTSSPTTATTQRGEGDLRIVKIIESLDTTYNFI